MLTLEYKIGFFICIKSTKELWPWQKRIEWLCVIFVTVLPLECNHLQKQGRTEGANYEYQ